MKVGVLGSGDVAQTLASGLLKHGHNVMIGSRTPEKLADWAAGKKANELYAKSYAVVAYPGIDALPQNYPPNAEKAMIKNDMEWMAKNRERILAEWTKRYDGKSAPKK